MTKHAHSTREQTEPTVGTITRTKIYPSIAQPGPAWRWLYSVAIGDAEPTVIDGRIVAESSPVEVGTSLAVARRWATDHGASRITERWNGGKAWRKGPRGGLVALLTWRCLHCPSE